MRELLACKGGAFKPLMRYALQQQSPNSHDTRFTSVLMVLYTLVMHLDLPCQKFLLVWSTFCFGSFL